MQRTYFRSTQVVASVSASLHNPCLFDYVGCIFVVFSLSLGLNIPLPPSLRGSPSLTLTPRDHDLGSLNLLPLVAGWQSFNDKWLDTDPWPLQNIRIIYSLPSLLHSLVWYYPEFLGSPASVCWLFRQCQGKLEHLLPKLLHHHCPSMS